MKKKIKNLYFKFLIILNIDFFIKFFYVERDLVYSKVTLKELKKLITEKKQFDCLFMKDNNE